ncbi:MAG TPA: hypothetical protein VGJ13_05180 [Pseudonocardiaceae bacterium]|jgi:hypothetical protein
MATIAPAGPVTVPPVVVVGSRARVLAARVAAPAGLYVLTQALVVAVAAAMAAVQGHTLNLHAWDGDWYLQIARHGYAAPAGLADAHGPASWWAPMAFFPAYPLLVRAVAPLVGWHWVVAGVAVSLAAGMVAACGVAALARRVTGSRRAELLAVVLVAAAPMSIVLAMTYPAGLVIAGTVWALVGVLQRRWVLAALGAVLAGASAPVGLPAAVVVMIGALVAIRDGQGPRWWPVVALFAAPTGAYGYLLWVARQVGSVWGWSQIQRQGWDTGWDGGVSTARFLLGSLTGREVFPLVTAAVVVAAVGLLAWAWRRLPWPVWLHAALLLALVLGSGGMVWDKARDLLPAAALLIPVAVVLASKPGRAGVLPVVVLVAFGVWFSGYGLTVWPYSI